MRVLVVHNRYSSRVPSGENLAVQDEVRWLRDAGVEVHTYEVSNDDVFDAGAVQRVRQAAESVWSLSAARQVRGLLDRVQPDLVHVHNLFPLLSTSVPWTAGKRAPVVWTVHNQRVVCVIGTHFRDGQPCHLCRPGWRVPGIRYACYGQSRAGSALVTVSTSVFRQLAKRRLTAVAISNHVREWLVGSAGFAADRVRVKYDGVDGPADADVAPAASRRTFLFAGYLTDYKGVALLLDAWRQAELPDDVELRFVGDGPLGDEVRAAAATDERITFLGHVPASEMPAHFDAARVVVLPSLWEEPFGRSAAEALAYGRPVITTGLGGSGEIVDEGCGWTTGRSREALVGALEAAAQDDAAVTRRGDLARRRHAELFSPQATTKNLLEIYEHALVR